MKMVMTKAGAIERMKSSPPLFKVRHHSFSVARRTGHYCARGRAASSRFAANLLASPAKGFYLRVQLFVFVGQHIVGLRLLAKPCRPSAGSASSRSVPTPV
jgi:hypothetical protein